MVRRSRWAGVAGIVATMPITVASGQGLGDYMQSARDACADQIDSAFNVLHGVCTAAAVIDLAATPDPSCHVARGIVVEYVKACMEHAAALMRDGAPVNLPPFPDLGSGLNQLAESPAGPAPAPANWPLALIVAWEQLPVMAASVKHEMLGGLMGATLGATIGGRQGAVTEGAVVVPEPDAAASAEAVPATGSTGEAAQDAAVGPTDPSSGDE